MTQTIITAGDASAGLTQSAGNDGTLVLQTGPAGSKVNAITLAADGTPTLLKPSKLDAAAVVSMVRLNTANGYGSTNTKIRRFTNVVTNQGTDITYNSGTEATLGASFTINTNGIYAVNYSDQFSAACTSGLTLNTTQPALGIGAAGQVASEILDANTAAAAGYAAKSGWTGYLSAGSVIRPQTDGVSTGANTWLTQFTIARVA